MTDPVIYLIVSAAGLMGVTLTALAGLIGWRGWLSLKQMELQRGEHHAPAHPSASARIEIADLKERIRKLEAIAAGVDL